jgi:hypothetical protein
MFSKVSAYVTLLLFLQRFGTRLILALLWPQDGLVWSEIQRSYSTNITLTTGEVFVTHRRCSYSYMCQYMLQINAHSRCISCIRERPKLIFASDGVPTHLTNGAITSEGTYTVIAPLAA